MRESVLLLHHAIYDEEVVTLEEFNLRMQNFELGYMETANRCSNISAKYIRPSTRTFSLPQSGM